MTEPDDMLRDLTSDVEDATPMARARMRADVLRRIIPAPRPRWRRPARLVPLAGGLAAAAIAASLVLNTGDGGPSLVQRAEAAVTPPGEIVHIVAGHRGVGDQAGSIEATLLEDWSLAGQDGSLRMRRFISTGPSTRAPDDEDTILELDAAGRITRAASWTPDDRISLGFPAETTPYANSWAGLLSKAYRDGHLKDAGTAGDGLRVVDGTIEGLRTDERAGCAPHQRAAPARRARPGVLRAPLDGSLVAMRRKGRAGGPHRVHRGPPAGDHGEPRVAGDRAVAGEGGGAHRARRDGDAGPGRAGPPGGRYGLRAGADARMSGQTPSSAHLRPRDR